jgi:hypothetical protein
MLCLSYYTYVFSSTKSVTGAERDLPETNQSWIWRVSSTNCGSMVSLLNTAKTVETPKEWKKTWCSFCRRSAFTLRIHILVHWLTFRLWEFLSTGKPLFYHLMFISWWRITELQSIFLTAFSLILLFREF